MVATRFLFDHNKESIGFNMKFNPNKLISKEYKWATFIPDRKPDFKVYHNRGHATSSLKSHSVYTSGSYVIPPDCTLWEHNGTEWVEIMFRHTYSRDSPNIL